MKASLLLSVAALGGLAQSSILGHAEVGQLTTSSSTLSSASASATPSAYVRIKASSNSSLEGLYGYVDARNDGGSGVVFQFTGNKSAATPFQLQVDPYYGTLLHGYKPDYVAGGSNAEGTPTGGAVFIAPRNQYIQGGEPLINVSVGNKSHVVTMTDQLGDGLVRNITQACLVEGFTVANTSLPMLVVGEKRFKTDGCASITLVWDAIH